MSNQIFRKKSLDRINSPEQLTEYIKVSNPAVWMLLIAVVILLVGVCVWGVMGRLDTKLSVCAISDGEHVVCYVSENDIEAVQSGMLVEINGTEYQLTKVESSAVRVDDNFSEYAMHVGNLQTGEWAYQIETDAVLDAGVYTANIIVDRVSPISFIMN